MKDKKIWLSFPYLIYHGFRLFLYERYTIGDRDRSYRIAYRFVGHYALFRFPVVWLYDTINWLFAGMLGGTGANIITYILVYLYGVLVTYLFCNSMEKLEN